MTYLWQMTLLGGICTLLLLAAKVWVLKKGGGKWYCGLWILVLIAYLLPYKLTFSHSVFSKDVHTAIVFSPASEFATNRENRGDRENRENRDTIDDTDMRPTAALFAQTKDKMSTIPFDKMGIALYGIGFVGVLLYYLFSYIFLQIRIYREAEQVSCQVLQDVKKEMGINRNILLKLNSQIQTPLFFGICRPTILLPAKSYTKEERYLLYSHELTHYKSHHLFLRLLALFTHILHWYNPLSYVALRQIQEACEYACDEGVTKNMDSKNRLAYGYLLLQGVCSTKESVFSLGFGRNQKKDMLKRRLGVIMEEKKKKKIQKAGIAVLAVGTLVVCGSFFDLKPIYAGGKAVQETAAKSQGFLWTDHVKTEKEAISLATQYIEKVFHGNTKGLSVTAVYDDGKGEKPEGWLIRFTNDQKTKDTKEYAVWLTKEDNSIEVRQNTFEEKEKEGMTEEAWQKLLEDDFWKREAKKFVENSPWEKEKIVDTEIIQKEGLRKQEEVCVSVDTESGATYLLYFHPWKELYTVQYYPAVQVEYQVGTNQKGLLWTEEVKSQEDAITFAKEYVEKVLHGHVESLVATAEYHDKRDNSIHPEGWFVQLSSQGQNEREYAIWLEKEGNQVLAKQKSLENKTKKMQYNQMTEERDALLQDKFWIAEGKKIVENSTLQKEKITDAQIVPQQQSELQYDVTVEVDTESGTKYLVSFHPWKELSSVEYCPPTHEDLHIQNLEDRQEQTIVKMENVEQVKVNRNTSSTEETPTVFVTTKNQESLTPENVKNIQELVGKSTKDGVQGESVTVAYQKDHTFSMEPGKEKPSPFTITMEKENIADNKTRNVVVEQGHPVLVETPSLPGGLPVKGKISAEFDGKKHMGVDIDTNQKALPILATADGIVIEAKFDENLGHYVAIDHGNGWVTKYAHNAKNLVQVGDTVKKGKEIAITGKTGMATGVHCHYEVWQNGISQNPRQFMS